MVALIPFTRLVVGRSIGPTPAAIVPLVAAAPLWPGLVESLPGGGGPPRGGGGQKPWALPTGRSSIRCFCQNPFLPGAGDVHHHYYADRVFRHGGPSAAGLGDIAVRAGYHRYQPDVMIITIILLVIIVQIIQFLFNLLAKCIDKRNK